MQACPMFLDNKEWYEEHVDKNGNISYTLTDKAPKEAIESFNEFMNPSPLLDENGNNIVPDGFEVYR